MDNFWHNTKTLLPSKEYNIFQNYLLIISGRRSHPKTKEGRSHYYSPLITTSIIPRKEQGCTYFASIKDCEDSGFLLLSRTILQRNNTICYKTSNIMCIKVKMLRLWVIYQIISKLSCTLIVTFQHSGQFRTQTKLGKNIS